MANSELVEALFVSFSTFLSSNWTRPRLPYGFIDSVQAARSAPHEDTSRIFYLCGFKAWVAYFVVKPRKVNLGGQAAQRDRFAALDALSVEEKRNLAERVQGEWLHPTVAELIKTMEATAEIAEQPAAAAVPWKRRRTDDRLIEHDYIPPQDKDHTNLQICHDASQPNISSTRREQDVSSGADIQGLNLFPVYLRGSIRKDDAAGRKIAAVSMNFPRNVIADVDSVMTMEVLPNKVEYLALQLFGAQLETNGKIRELVLPGGTTAITYRLQGARPESVREIFGELTAAAIEEAPYRKREISIGEINTRCVSMSDFVEADKGAIVTLTLGMTGASQIFEKLFKSQLYARYAIPHSQVIPMPRLLE